MGEITFVPWNKMIVPFFGEVSKTTALLVLVLFVLLFFIILFYKEWKITTFDPALAASLGIPVIFMNNLFMGIVSITTVAFFDAVGAMMVVAMLITSAASAYLWTDKLIHMIFTSGIFGIASAIVGYYIADWIDTSISGSLQMELFFLLVFYYHLSMAYYLKM